MLYNQNVRLLPKKVLSINSFSPDIESTDILTISSVSFTGLSAEIQFLMLFFSFKIKTIYFRKTLTTFATKHAPFQKIVHTIRTSEYFSN